jgi:hypothetical protein
MDSSVSLLCFPFLFSFSFSLCQSLLSRTPPLGFDRFQESAIARDTLARHIYGSLFAWLLAVINRAADECISSHWCVFACVRVCVCVCVCV